MGQPYDHDLAQPSVDLGIPAHRVHVVEPALRERGAVRQHAVDVDHAAAPAAADAVREIGKAGHVPGIDQGHAGHGGGFPLP